MFYRLSSFKSLKNCFWSKVHNMFWIICIADLTHNLFWIIRIADFTLISTFVTTLEASISHINVSTWKCQPFIWRDAQYATFEVSLSMKMSTSCCWLPSYHIVSINSLNVIYFITFIILTTDPIVSSLKSYHILSIISLNVIYLIPFIIHRPDFHRIIC